jgi:ribonucleoside-diphosphate reductase alpha chain
MTRNYYWLNKDSRTFLKRGYLSETETPEERFQVIADTAEKYLKIAGFADKFLDYLSNGWYSLSTPVLINFGNARGLPISCFNSHVSDSIEDFLIKQAEVGYMSKCGGGTSGYFGDIRSRGTTISTGGIAEGPVRAMELFDNVTNIVNQGASRRGHFAAYLPIDHPDIEEFLKIRGEGHTIQDMSIGVCVSDEWMNKMIDGDKQYRKIWSLVIKKRSETGYPYVFFTDNVNNNAPQVYKDKGLKINSSNMCAEITLSSTKDESFVCNLSSMNLLHYDEWKDTDAVETLIYFLDAVMSEFIDKTVGMPLMVSPRRFAINQRALGLGVLGWHSYLQSKLIPFESILASSLNRVIWKNIRTRCDKATEELATLFGEPDLLKGYGRRNVTTIAIAPTTSSSFILGQVSPSIEPLNSNYYVKDLAKGKFTYKNPWLEHLFENKGTNTPEIWKSILIHGGSVQHLVELSQDEKDAFKTFGEISQKAIIDQAAVRQEEVDQGQSLNLMISPDATLKEINELMIYAWRAKIKTLYYQRSSSPTQKLVRDLMQCSSCEA